MRERSALIELAEEPSLALADETGRTVVHGEGYILVARRGWGTVEQVRLADVARGVAEVARVGAAHDLAYVNWWVGVLSEPADAAERLLALGLEPDPEMPVSRTLVIEHEPAGEPAVEVRIVEDADGYVATRRIAVAVWSDPKGTEDDWRADWEALSGSTTSRFYLAYVDGEPVGFGRSVFTPQATMLMGGAVLPAARGRGVYVSLVHARWRDAAARGVPRLLVGAGPMSAPILERLGFDRISETRVLRQHLGSGHGDDRIG